MPGKKKSAAKKGAAKKATKASPKGAVKKGAKKGTKPRAKRAGGTAAAAPTGRPEARDHVVTREHAVAMHKRHVGTRRSRGAMPDGHVGGMFSKEAVLKLLQQPGTEYMRFYYGKHDDGSPGIVLAASDEKLGIVGGEQAMFLDDHLLCPPWCAPGDTGLT